MSDHEPSIDDPWWKWLNGPAVLALGLIASVLGILGYFGLGGESNKPPATRTQAPSTNTTTETAPPLPTTTEATTLPPTTTETAPPPSPHVSFLLGRQEGAVGQPLRFTYHATNVFEGQHVALQRQVGTAEVWTTIKNLPPNDRRGQVVPTHIGKTRYRAIVADDSGKLASSSARPARIYGPVPFKRVTGGTINDTVRLGGSLFRYVWYEVWDHQFKISASTCRAVNLRIGFRQGDIPKPAADLTVVSERASPIRVTIPNNTVRTVAGRVGGDIAIYAANGQVGGFSDDTIFINGTLDCYTFSGS